MSFASYARDQVGNPITVTTTSGVANYTYDLLDRLTEACYAAACPGSSDPFVRFAYDVVGNRTSEARPSGSKTYSYNSADQMTSVVNSLGATTTYGYDANGNQTEAGLARRYTYDRANRVSSVADGPLTTTYAYHGDGVRYRAAKNVAGTPELQTTKYTWDKNGALPQLTGETVDVAALRLADRRFVRGNGLESMTIAGEPHFYHHDGLGSVVNVTDDTGATEWAYEYEPFGVAKTETKSNPVVPDNPMKFTGEYQDPTGLYHLRARQMDPTTGRFLSTDPLAPAITDPYVSAYTYVNNMPTVLVDPSGKRGQKIGSTGFLTGYDDCMQEHEWLLDYYHAWMGFTIYPEFGSNGLPTWSGPLAVILKKNPAHGVPMLSPSAAWFGVLSELGAPVLSGVFAAGLGGFTGQSLYCTGHSLVGNRT